MLTMIVPWLFLISLPLAAMKWGWIPALLHTAYVLISSMALAQLLLIGFRKIPFTCTHVVSKDKVLVMVILFLVGYSFFGPANAEIEAGLLDNPARLLLLPMLYAAIVAIVRIRERELPPAERVLIFDDRPQPEIQVLDLSTN